MQAISAAMGMRLAKSLAMVLAAALWMAQAAFPRETWRYGEVNRFEVYSLASENSMRKVVEELVKVEAALKVFLPSLSLRGQQRLKVIVFSNARQIADYAPLYEGKPKKIGGLYRKTLDGDMMMIALGEEFAQTRSTVYHEYIHFLISGAGLRLPAWLNEGLAETFSTIDFGGRKTKIGLGEPYNVQTLMRSKPLPLERFFQVVHSSPEYNSDSHGRGMFYAQSWGMVHYLMFGNHDFPEGAFQKLAASVMESQWIQEDDFREIFGIGFDEMEKRLQRYAQGGRYTYRFFDLDPQFDEDWEIEKVDEGSASLFRGMLLLANRDPKEAYGHLSRASALMPQSHEAAAYLGYHSYRQELWDFALDEFERAIELGSASPSLYWTYADAKMRTLNPQRQIGRGRFNQSETVELLTALFKARELGERSPRLYARIGEVWLSSSVEPNDKHLNALREGLRLHPDHAHLAFYLAWLSERIGQREEAEAVARLYLKLDLDGSLTDDFQSILTRLETGQR